MCYDTCHSFFAAAISFILHLDKHMSAMIQQHGTATYAILWTIVFCETGLVLTPFLPGDSLLFAAGAFAGEPIKGAGYAHNIASFTEGVGRELCPSNGVPRQNAAQQAAHRIVECISLWCAVEQLGCSGMPLLARLVCCALSGPTIGSAGLLLQNEHAPCMDCSAWPPL